jgi:hypothetical protein
MTLKENTMLRKIIILTAVAVAGACGSDDKEPSGESPIISDVTVAFDPNCVAAFSSPVLITTTAVDEDTDIGDLTYSGSVEGCTGSIDSASASVSCPQLAPYSGSVTVTDPEGNSDTESFTFGVCTP